MSVVDQFGKVAVTLGQAIGLKAGEEKLAYHKLGLGLPTLEVTSTDFTTGAMLPLSATADGEGTPPGVSWRGVPAGTRSIAVVVEDPDAPVPEPFLHWLLYGVDATTTSLDAGAAVVGKNSKLEPVFAPAEPPPGHGLHHYHFQVFALDRELSLGPNAGRSAVIDAMKDHVLAWGDLIGTYERAPS